MAYDEKLADRVRKLLAKHKTIAEKKMFGGVAGEDSLAEWPSMGMSHAASLPGKKK